MLLDIKSAHQCVLIAQYYIIACSFATAQAALAMALCGVATMLVAARAPPQVSNGLTTATQTVFGVAHIVVANTGVGITAHHRMSLSFRPSQDSMPFRCAVPMDVKCSILQGRRHRKRMG